MQEERAKRAEAGSRRRAGAGLLRGRLLLPSGGAAGSAREDGRPCSGGAARKEQLPSRGPEERCSSPPLLPGGRSRGAAALAQGL